MWLDGEHRFVNMNEAIRIEIIVKVDNELVPDRSKLKEYDDVTVELWVVDKLAVSTKIYSYRGPYHNNLARATRWLKDIGILT